MFGLCEIRCQLWDWAIVRMYRSTHRRFKVMWMTSIFVLTAIAQVLVVVQCWRVSTPITWWRVYRRMIIGGFSPSWCMIWSTPWPTNRRRLLRRWKPMNPNCRRKTIQTWQSCSQTCGQRTGNGNRSRLGSPGSTVIVAVRAMVAVQTMRSMQVAAPIGGILRNAIDAIRWGTLHGIVQALHRWSAEYSQRLRQRRQRHQLETIGWQLRAEKAHRKRAGTWIVPPPLTFAQIGKCSYGTRSVLKEMSGKIPALLEGSQARPSDMVTYNWGFGCLDIAEIMRWMWETSGILREHTTHCHNCRL